MNRAQLITEARSWIGTPYRHQASLKGAACDCLGLIRGLYRFAYGAEPQEVPAYSPDWAEAGKIETLLDAARQYLLPIGVEAAQPGDVLLFRWKPNMPAKHCAILVTPRRIVHAYDAAGKVAEGNLQAQWEQRIAGAFAFPDLETI